MNSGIEVYFTKLNKPWSNLQPGPTSQWVNVYSPDGSEKIGVPAPNGFVSIDLPPGRYLVTGTTHGVYVNFDSNETIVNVGCGQRPCVTIIPKSLHSCVWWVNAAFEMIQNNPTLAPEVAQHIPAALAIMKKIEAVIPREQRQLAFRAQELDILKKQPKP